MENHRVFTVDSIHGNMFLGNGVAPKNTGIFNTATGFYSLFSNTTVARIRQTDIIRFFPTQPALYNTATGADALYSNTTGSFNTASGFNSLYHNTTGYANTAMGTNALNDNDNGHDNTAIGTGAMFYNIWGIGNTSIGSGALSANQSGSNNTASGVFALVHNTSDENTANGAQALYWNTTGYDNTASGTNALYNNTGGVVNTAQGAGALFSNTTGSYNTAVGTDALYNNVDAYYNCAIGYLAMAFAKPGWNNVAVGSFAGPDANVGEVYNSIALGVQSITTAPNQARIGNSSTTSIGGYTNWTNISDGRVKRNIKENIPGLAFINKLKPVTYNLDLDAADKIMQAPARKDKDGKTIELSSQEVYARNAKQQIVYTGFVAQDVEIAAKELNYDFSGVDIPKNEKDLYGLRYSEFVVPLVQSVQELSKISDQKDATIGQLQKQIDDQEKRIEALEAILDVKTPATDNTQQMPGLSGATLEQNIPNPFANNTTIGYTLPQKYAAAQIVITDKNGRIVKQVDISGSGKGIVTIDLTTLSLGTYQYSLVIDGQNMNTKQMMLAK
jgi:hypothetical protein